MEEADAGYACCSGFETGVCVFRGDATEGVDGDGRGGGAGFAQAVEADAGVNGLACDEFFEDRGEEDGVGVLASGLFDFGYGMAGDGDQGLPETGFGVEMTKLEGV